ncbi:hypothetical protein PC9H_008302 [Pleurotus ostreatus]|uniref:F-box domain-containing protein n=1 Tax=Pleurotus ostreatus TaxID=5322 RepID=A0A8H7DQ52_PLEOS|nr:uncharacterized protein PC9H_008302 [Pleurotus ostreatus]KAF7425940.1 hypothetical protein PC9H_008302 [Pleurotus ostreatus]
MSSNRILRNVDILRRIFKHSDSSQNYDNVLVSKVWSNQALSILWRTLDSLLPLLRLLGPMTLASGEGRPYYKYDRLINSEDWVVFQRYAWRVRRIEIGYMRPPNFSDSVFMDIIIASRTLSGVELLPNLQSLSSEDTLFIQKWIPLFINKSLSALDLRVSGPVDMHLLTRTLSHLHHLCPKLQNLSLSTEFELDDAPQFDAALSSLLSLKELDLSSPLLSLSTINTLAHLPYLETFTISDMDGEESTLPAMPLSDAFPSLGTFASDAAGFRSIASFLEAYEPRKLHTLYVYSASTESRATYQSLVAAIASACPDIKDLHLLSKLVADIEPIADPLLSTISYHLTALTSLKLNSPPPLKLDVGCMKALLTALPSLHTLKLLEKIGPPTLPLSALSELAPLCPVMRFLALYLDTKHVSASAPPNAIFPCLEVLNVQSSPLESSARDVATFLGSVLPLTCVVQHSHYIDGPERLKWRPVVDFLPLIFELRAAKQAFNPIAPSEK